MGRDGHRRVHLALSDGVRSSDDENWGQAMNGLEITVTLGAAVFAGPVLAPRLALAAPLLLLRRGLVLGFVPELRHIELHPEMVLLIFLPVMLFWESLTTS